jgi:tRNA uridine 5-carboxymethylaminomethyl modification enzyme
MQEELLSYPNLSVLEGKVADVMIQNELPADEEDREGRLGKITGVQLESGEIIPTNQVVITTGTFLGGEIHIGWFRPLCRCKSYQYPLGVDFAGKVSPC